MIFTDRRKQSLLISVSLFVFGLFLFIDSFHGILASGSIPISTSILKVSSQGSPNSSTDTYFFENGTITKPLYMGMKMNMPADGTWRINDCTTNITLYHFPNPNTGITDADLSIIGPFHANGGPAGLWGQIITNMDASTYPDYSILEYENTTINNNPAVKIIYTMQNPTGIIAKNMKVIVERGDDTSKAWLIQYFTDSEQVYNNLLPTITNMIDSFELVSGGQFGNTVCSK